jgi:hypothetical protein
MKGASLVWVNFPANLALITSEKGPSTTWHPRQRATISWAPSEGLVANGYIIAGCIGAAKMLPAHMQVREGRRMEEVTNILSAIAPTRRR